MYSVILNLCPGGLGQPKNFSIWINIHIVHVTRDRTKMSCIFYSGYKLLQAEEASYSYLRPCTGGCMVTFA